jgi:hypothetical protein|mmetsp:Transcript_113797/g.179067  ORF Transcript_113797/g.179067 Transcript_113797/m.179067 type:complete len:352 (+) Transcript_113797:101-1156(+)
MPPPPARFSQGAVRGARYGAFGPIPDAKNAKNGYPGVGYPDEYLSTEKRSRTGEWCQMSPHIMGFGIAAWIVFTLTSVFCGFFYHNNEILFWIFVVVGGMIAARVIYMNIVSYVRPQEPGDISSSLDRKAQLTMILVTAWITFSFLCGFGVGIFAHELYIRKFWLSQELAVRQNVLPSEPAAAYANAGEIGFAEEARIDLSKTIGYKDVDVYCVAPIAGDIPLEKVQFWASGMNCCGARSGFVCDDAWDPKARAGIVLHDNEHSQFVKDMRPYYKQAVKMAEATYQIASVDEPVFVKWVANPDTVERNFAKKGFATIVGGVMIAVILCACIAFAVGSASNLEANTQGGRYS